MADKGEYRGIYVALPDSWEFQQLSADARAIFYPLKLKLGKAGIDAFYPEVLPRLTGIPFEGVSKALQELEEKRWLIVEQNIYWIRNGLRFEPNMPLSNTNGRKGIANHLKTLPNLAIVRDFARYYDLGDVFEIPAEATPSEGGSKPLRATETETETETDIPPGVAHAREPLESEVEPFVGYGDLPDEAPPSDFHLADDDLVAVPGDTGAKVIALRPPRTIEDVPFRHQDWEGRVSGNVVLREWINLQPTPPSRRDRDRYGAACKTLADEHTTGEIALAIIGMRYLWPYGDPDTGKSREPWTPEDLLRVFAKALPAARHHPQFTAAQEEHEFNEALKGGGW